MEKKERAKDLGVLDAFCRILARYCYDLTIDISFFNYKTPGGPMVRQGVRKNMPIDEAFWTIMNLLDEYDKGEDILWRPAYDVYTKDRKKLVNFIWLDDYIGLKTPWLEVKTSPGKVQAYFLLTKPVPVEIADEIQKRLARQIGDKGAGSFVQHRRFPGLVNGKYADEPLCVMFGPFEGGVIDPDEVLRDTPRTAHIAVSLPQVNQTEASPSPQMVNQTTPSPTQTETEASQPSMASQTPQVRAAGVPTNLRQIKVLNYVVYIKDRTAFDHPTGDQSAIDFSWCLSMARSILREGVPEVVAAMIMEFELLRQSPEVHKRKKTIDHLRDYLIRTVAKAIDIVKRDLQKEREAQGLDFLDF